MSEKITAVKLKESMQKPTLFLSPGEHIWPTAISKVQMPGGWPGGGACWSFKLIDT